MNQTIKKIIAGICLTLSIIIIAIFGRIGGASLQARIDIGGIDLGGIGLDIQTDNFGFSTGGSGGGGESNKAPGCKGSNCLTIPDASEYKGITAATSFRDFLITWTNFFLGFLTLISMIAIIYSGFLYITAAGNDDQTGKAKKIIMWVVIGIVIILLAYALVNTLITTGPTGRDTL
jgi:hypothetical protein